MFVFQRFGHKNAHSSTFLIFGSSYKNVHVQRKKSTKLRRQTETKNESEELSKDCANHAQNASCGHDNITCVDCKQLAV